MENRARRVRRSDSAEFSTRSSGSAQLAHGGASGRSSGDHGMAHATNHAPVERKARPRIRCASHLQNRIPRLNQNPGPSAQELSRRSPIAAGCPACWNKSCRPAIPSACSSKSPGMATQPERTPTRPRSICCSARCRRAAIILEGHTSSRNLGESAIRLGNRSARKSRLDPPAGRRISAPHRSRRRPGQKHSAQYVNVTEAYWDEALRASLRTVTFLKFCFHYAGCPMISFAKFKGPTRLAISNLFGLIPDPSAIQLAWSRTSLTLRASVAISRKPMARCSR